MEEMTTKSRSKLDALLWLLVLLLAASGVFANYYFSELAWSLRVTLGIVLVCGLFGLGILTTRGKKIWAFIKDAKMELHKVVWPTRDETVKTTAVVAALVFAMSVVLWCIDSVLLWAVSWLTR